MISRRGLIGGLVGLVAAPAIVRADSLMKLAMPRRPRLPTINDITREAIALFKNSNMFLQNIDEQYANEFARDGAKIASCLQIRLPNNYRVGA